MQWKQRLNDSLEHTRRTLSGLQGTLTSVVRSLGTSLEDIEQTIDARPAVTRIMRNPNALQEEWEWILCDNRVKQLEWYLTNQGIPVPPPEDDPRDVEQRQIEIHMMGQPRTLAQIHRHWEMKYKAAWELNEARKKRKL